MLSWFQALMPKEERFFDLFDRHAVTIVAGAHALRALLDGDEKAPEHCKEIKRYENDADEITRDVLLAVRRTFQVASWIKTLENHMARVPSDDPMAGYEFGWLWKELGIADHRR